MMELSKKGKRFLDHALGNTDILDSNMKRNGGKWSLRKDEQRSRRIKRKPVLHGLYLPLHVSFYPSWPTSAAWRPTSVHFPSGFQGLAAGGAVERLEGERKREAG